MFQSRGALKISLHQTGYQKHFWIVNAVAIEPAKSVPVLH